MLLLRLLKGEVFFFMLDLGLEIFLLLERRSDVDIVRRYLLQTILDHAFDQKFAIAEQTNASPFFYFTPTFVQFSLAAALEWTCLLQTLFAIRVATELTVTVLEIRGFLPRITARVAPLRSVVIVARIERALHKEDALSLNELVLFFTDAEGARRFNKHIHFVKRVPDRTIL